MALISSNPTLRSGFDRAAENPGWATPSLLPGTAPSAPATMTLSGSVAKTAFLLLVVIATASLGWSFDLPGAALLGIFVATLVCNLLIVFSPSRARFLAVPYAAMQGLTVGSVSKWYAAGMVVSGASGTGLVWTAIGATVSIFAGLLFLYATRIFKPTENFKLAVGSAALGVFFFYLATLALRLFGFEMPLVHSTGTFGLAFSVVMVVLASACLVIDFDFVENAVASKLPRHMEWYAAFGLMVSLVWLYVEVLRLLAKLQARSRN